MNWPDAVLWPVKVTWPTALLEWSSVVNPGGGAKPVPVPVLPITTRTCVPGMLPKVTVTDDTLTLLPMSTIRPVAPYRLPKCGDPWYESVVQSVAGELSIASPVWSGLSPPLPPSLVGPYAAALLGCSTVAGVLLGDALWLCLAL